MRERERERERVRETEIEIEEKEKRDDRRDRVREKRREKKGRVWEEKRRQKKFFATTCTLKTFKRVLNTCCTSCYEIYIYEST